MSTENRRIIENYWETMQTNNFWEVGRQLHDDYVLEWPQTGELIRGRENFARINEEYPATGRWEFQVDRIIADENGGASEVRVTEGQRQDQAVSFFEIRDGRIWRMVEYWPEPGTAPEWRKEWVETVGPSGTQRTR